MYGGREARWQIEPEPPSRPFSSWPGSSLPGMTASIRCTSQGRSANAIPLATKILVAKFRTPASNRKNSKQGGVRVSTVKLRVNGRAVSVDVEDRTLLVHLLRENLNLTGAHIGCDTSQCGACVVHLDGRAVKSCTTLAVMADGHEVRTIEGLAADGGPLHPMQEAFREHHGLQCGFCTPGMIMTAVDIVHRRGQDLSDQTIREELEGNLCRCTGYQNIVQSIAAGAKAMANTDLA